MAIRRSTLRLGHDGPAARARRAPEAGFSLGGGPNGAVLSQLVVPEVAVKPPSITGMVNMQLTGVGGLPVLSSTTK